MKKRKPMSEETKRKISIALSGRIVGPPSEETKKKIAEANRGRVLSFQALTNIREGAKHRKRKILELNFTCQKCGKQLHVKPRLLRIGKKYCSVECYSASMPKGERSRNWKGGITTISKTERAIFYHTTRLMVLKRDNYKCQICGKGGHLM